MKYRIAFLKSKSSFLTIPWNIVSKLGYFKTKRSYRICCKCELPEKGSLPKSVHSVRLPLRE